MYDDTDPTYRPAARKFVAQWGAQAVSARRQNPVAVSRAQMAKKTGTPRKRHSK